MILGNKFLDLGLTEIDRSINKRKKAFDDWCNNYIEKIIEKTENSKD